VTSAAVTAHWSGPTDLREDGYRLGNRKTRRIAYFHPNERKCWWSDAPYEETFYPGQYTLTILIDGVESGRGTFTITGRTTIHEAALQDNVSLLDSLLRNGADPDERDSSGQTPLFTAAFYGSATATRLLLQNGANINAQDSRGQTALFHLALGYDGNPAGAIETANLLIDRGIDVSIRDKDGQSILDSIISFYEPGIEDLLDLLLEHGLKVDEKDDKGQTPLARLSVGCWHYPEGKSRLAECLLRHGADINAHDNNGRSVLNHCVWDNNEELIKVLLAHGANPNQPDVDANGNKTFPLILLPPYNSQKGGIHLTQVGPICSMPLHECPTPSSRRKGLSAKLPGVSGVVCR